MKLLIWNINKKDNADLALTFMREEEIGVAAFAEFSGTNFSAELLKSSGFRPISHGGCDKVVVFAQESIEVLECYEESRFTVLPMKMGETYFVVAAAHLVDRMSSADPESRLVDIRKMMGVIHGYEYKASINKTIVMGDLNANPYDKELLLPNAFNAMLFKEIVRNKATRTWCGEEYPFLYNPTVHWLSEESENYGSFYYSGFCTIFGQSPAVRFTDIFDQATYAAEHMVKDHIFEDGNKRTSLVFTLSVLRLAGAPAVLSDAPEPNDNQYYAWIQDLVSESRTTSELAEELRRGCVASTGDPSHV